MSGAPGGPGRARLDGIELVRLRLPLVTPWRTALGTLTERDVLLVRAVLDGVEGWGECVAQPEPTYSAEDVDGAAGVLERHLVPRLLAAGVTRGGDVAPALAPVKGHPMAKAALELAVLDAELRRSGVGLAEHLRSLARRREAARPGPGGAARPPAAPGCVPAGVAIGVTGSLPALLDEVDRRVGEGYRRVKLKIHPGWDAEPVAAVRRAHPDLPLQVDANGAYAGHPNPPAALRPLDEHGLLLIEQPLADDDLLGHAALAAGIATPVCLDESITSVGAAATALALGACSIVNVKAGRVGGYLAAVALHDLCAERGVPVWCGGMVETGVGRAANLALATLPNFTLVGDLSAADRFWARDIVSPPAELRAGGTIAVPDGPGLGVRVDLSGQAVWRAWAAAAR